jgi:hypothetical protein
MKRLDAGTVALLVAALIAIIFVWLLVTHPE